jgi:hypothetical protein
LVQEFGDHDIYLNSGQYDDDGEVHRFLDLPHMCLQRDYRVNDDYHDGVVKLSFLELPFYYPNFSKGFFNPESQKQCVIVKVGHNVKPFLTEQSLFIDFMILLNGMWLATK